MKTIRTSIRTLAAAWPLLVYSLLVVCLVQTEAARAQQTDAERALAESIAFVSRECDHKLVQIESLARFETFMDHLDQVIGHSEKPKRGLLNTEKNLRRCFDLAGPLVELRKIIKRRHDGVCRMHFVQQLLDFHAKHLTKQVPKEQQHQDQALFQYNKTTFVGHIFSLVAHQVAFTCKQRVSERLTSGLGELAHLECLPVIASFLPQQVEEVHEDATHDEEDSINANSMQSFLKNFKRIEDLALIVGKPLQQQHEPYFDVILAPSTLAKVDQLKELCRARQPHYMALFAPIASLAQIGYEMPDNNDKPKSSADEKLRCWLATAQLCQGILRTHINLKSLEAEEVEDASDVKKLVEIKFGPVPSDVQLDLQPELAGGEESEWEARQLPEVKLDSFEEVSPLVVELVKKRASLKGRVKGKMVAWAKKFVASHIDIDAMHEDSARKFMEALTRDQAGDSNDGGPVAFSGKKRNQGLFLPGRLVTDEADTLVQGTSFFVGKGIALIFSSVVAICLSAVFVWFTLYALITSFKTSKLPDASGNFKESWRQMRDQRMQTIDDKIKGKGLKAKMMVYRSPSG